MAVDQFLMLEKIPGEAIDDKRKGEIDVLAWSWGASQSGSTHMGGGGGAGKVSVQDMSITKYIDESSHLLFTHCAKGKHIPKAQLTVRKAGDTPLEYYIIAMEDVIVSSISTGGSGGEDRLTENITLNFASFCVSYCKQKADGSGEAAKEFSYDIPKNTDGKVKVDRKK